MLFWKRIILFAALLSLAVLPACQPQVEEVQRHRLRVVATTSLVWDVVVQVGGERVDASILLPYGVDPHSFSPSPQDVAKLAEADLVFANGIGLEEYLSSLIQNTGKDLQVVEISEGISLRVQEERLPGGEAEAESGGYDPHVWMDPNNVARWADNVAEALSLADVENAYFYQENAREYQQGLQELDAWIREEVSQVPEANRELVTDHLQYGYFADRYGFQQVGAFIPGFSTLAQPSAQEIARLEDAISQLNVKAIFIGDAGARTLAEQITEDTHTRLVFLYTHSLTEPGGEADNYRSFMEYNVSAIVEALK